MKFLSFLVLLPVFAYAAADISQFKGHIYKKAEYDVCLKDYDVITKNVNAVEGYTVLSGGCQEFGKDNYKMEFDYLHPLASYVDNYPVTLADEKTCMSYVAQAKNEIIASGNQLVATYCEGKELNTHFINTTHSIVRSLGRLGKFDTLADCSSFLANLTAKAKANKMTSFMSLCSEAKYDPTGKVYYSPVFNYISFYDIEMAAINGKTVPSVASCSNSVNTEANFTKNNVKVVLTYCSGVMSYEQGTQETVLYLVPKNEMRYITVYNGVVFNTKESCDAQLDGVVRGIESSGDGVLYGFCQKLSNNSYRPSITYIKKIQL